MNFLQEEHISPEINLVSLIDVVLILLIFMMISISITKRVIRLTKKLCLTNFWGL